jgi:ribosomal protein S2
MRLLLNRNKNKGTTKTKKLNKNKRWIFENNRGILFIYNVNNHKRSVRSSNVAYRNNGKRIVSVGVRRSNYVAVKSGGYRVPIRRRRRV